MRIAALVLAVVGCAPDEEPDENHVPVVLELSHEHDTEIALPATVYVIADDVDGDVLTLTWALSEIGQVPGEALDTPTGQGASIDLEADAFLVGQVLTCYVEDGEDLVLLRWTLVEGA